MGTLPPALRLAFFEFRVLRPYLRLRGSAIPGKIPRQNSQQLKLITKGAFTMWPSPKPRSTAAPRRTDAPPTAWEQDGPRCSPLPASGLFFFSQIFSQAAKKKMNLAPRGLLPLCREEKWLLYFNFFFFLFYCNGEAANSHRASVSPFIRPRGWRPRYPFWRR